MSTVLVVAGLIVLVGSVVQGAIGYGLNIIAGPLLALLDPALVPVPVLVVACAQAAMSTLRERGSVDWGGVGWAMLGRLPGNVLGLAVLATVAVSASNVVIGVSVLVCVALSLVTWHPSPTRPALVVAGIASGTFGTVSSIGGPPIALLYQHQSGPTVRGTLGAYFLLASVSSVVTLWAAGRVHTEHLVAAAVLVPFMVVGFLVSGPLRRFLHGGRVRVGVLVVAALSALVLIGQSVFG
ncbi:TSUP family transporter [Actinokineospora sp. NBRC 105648]|uniref:TSUP family transporter n=1 Tax=Actinokineospora sp. NBRC 105648 TaxID=3032206 RepID=UPI002555C481|nr:TSUP family transporter [Actinokineospora sp. NBRC 105648]